MNDHQAIIDYLARTPDIPDDLINAIQRWLAEHGAEAATIGALRKVWDNLPSLSDSSKGTPMIDAEIAIGLQKIMREINAGKIAYTPATTASETQPDDTSSEEPYNDEPQPSSPRRRIPLSWLSVAAACAVLLSCGSYILGTIHATPDHIPTKTLLAAVDGAVGHHTLPDGTQLWLNGGSTLTYYDTFDNGPERRVAINGEAYFEVTHDASRPFIVEMGEMDISVLGTTFNARSSSTTNTDEVVLLEGKVEVESSWLPEPVTMKPDQRIELNRKDHDVLVEPANAKSYCRWIAPVTVFDNEPLDDILIHISRRYGLALQIDDKDAANTRLSMTLHSSQELSEVISIIEHLLPVTISTHDHTLYLAEAAF